MLFHVRMDVELPRDLPHDEREQLIAAERTRAQQLQHDGIWLHLWRVVGHYSNISVFDVSSPDELHRILWDLPLFPYMTIGVTALASHPSTIQREGGMAAESGACAARIACTADHSDPKACFAP